MKTSLLVVASLVFGPAPLALRIPNSLVAESAADEVSRMEERLRQAKLNNDVAALERIFGDAYVGTNQNGNSRNKQQAIDLFRTFRIHSLTIDRASVRVTHNVAIVTGSQTERNDAGTDRMLFTRVYVDTENGWELVSSSQFRDPRLTQR